MNIQFSTYNPYRIIEAICQMETPTFVDLSSRGL